MLFERLEGVSFDLAALRRAVRELPARHGPPLMQGPSWGGWSLLSYDGDVRDGWHQGHTAIAGGVVDPAKARAFRRSRHYRRPTPACSGALAQVHERLRGLGLCPRRGRVALLLAGGETQWHHDAPAGRYAVRCHVPVFSNPGALFRVEGDEAHLPADGSAYLLRVDRAHQAVNRGAEERVHLVFDVWDFRGVSRRHRFERPRRTPR